MSPPEPSAPAVAGTAEPESAGAGLGHGLIGLLVGAAAILLAQAVTWAAATIPQVTGGSQRVSVHGHDVAPALPAIGWALLVLTIAVLASRGWLRRAVGLVAVAAGATAVAVAIGSRSRTGGALLSHSFAAAPTTLQVSPNAWWVLALAGGLAAIGSGTLIVLRGGTWRSMGRKYEAAPAAATEPAAGDAAWQALDRGEDPTLAAENLPASDGTRSYPPA